MTLLPGTPVQGYTGSGRLLHGTYIRPSVRRTREHYVLVIEEDQHLVKELCDLLIWTARADALVASLTPCTPCNGCEGCMSGDTSPAHKLVSGCGCPPHGSCEACFAGKGA
jgi:hypothetical protein